MSFPIIPFEKFTVVSYKSKEEILRLLAKNIDMKADLDVDTDGYSGSGFRGSLIRDQFVVRRGTSYKNDFNPVISGCLREGPGKTMIDVTVRFTDNALLATSIWLLLVGAIFIVAVFGASSVVSTIIVASFFLLGYFLPMAGYWTESVRGKKLLLEIVHGRISQPSKYSNVPGFK